MREILVDLNMLDTKDKIHDFFSTELETPQWYGRNLDALYDELTSVCEELSIICKGNLESLPVCTKGLVDVLQDASAANRYLVVEIESN